ncbi:MAG TPA: hypothetical protein VJ183_18160 [Chloroflexia bacterium]|nr:hypothetical protein [Chloroflexia bacterium]
MASRNYVIRTHKSRRAASSFAALFLLLASLVPFVGRVEAQQVGPPENPYGVNVFLHKEVEPWKIEQTLRMVSEANIAWIKQEFPWQEIEFKKGYFFDDKWQKSSWEKFDQIVDLADKYHLKVIARVDHAPDWAKSGAGGNKPLKDYKDLADFANAMLDHYKGRIQYVQVWNEPNLAGEWVPGTPVDPEGYVEMLKVVYPAIKAAHSDAVVLSAPMAMTLEGPQLRGNMNEIDYWNGMYQAGVKGFFDIASANGYGLDQPPDAAPDPKVLNFRRVELIRDVMVKNGDGERPIWFDEYAWNASPDTLAQEERDFWRHVTPQQQADWTVQGIDYARKNWPWAGVISVWYFRQVGDIPPERAEYYFAMVNPDFSAQPVYEAVKGAAAAFPGPASQPAGTPINPPPSPTSETVSTPQPSVRPEAETPALPTASTDAGPTPTGALASAPTLAPPETATVSGTVLTSTPGPGTLGGTSGGTNTILYIIGGVLVVGGLAGLGYYFVRNRAKDH